MSPGSLPTHGLNEPSAELPAVALKRAAGIKARGEGSIRDTVPPALDAPRSPGAARFRNRHLIAAGSLILLLPNILFAAQLASVPAAIMVLGAAAFVALMPWRAGQAQDSILDQRFDLRLFGLCGAGALFLLVWGGEGHLVYANWDWLWRDAVLADLTHGPFPPVYEAGGEHYILRAPLGMYMLPALAARVSTLGTGHAVLILQNTALLSAVLYILALLAGRHALLTIAVFLSFSGLDIAGTVLTWIAAGKGIGIFVLPSHIEGWAPWLQYSSTITQIFWVPNHALPAYWLALLALLCAQRDITIGTFGLVIAASLFWSPFAFAGALPLAAVLLVRDARTVLASSRFWLCAAAAACFLPAAFYMQIDAAQVPHALLLLEPLGPSVIAIFLVLEIPHAAFLGAVWGRLPPPLKSILGVSILVLLVLPTVKLGLYNDLVMRASIPALTILSIAFALSLPLLWRHKPVISGLAILIVLIGAVTPVLEIWRPFALGRFAISDCNLITVWKKIGRGQPALDNYLALTSRVPPRLMAIPTGLATAGQPSAVCWPDLPYDPTTITGIASNAVLLRSREGRPPL